MYKKMFKENKLIKILIIIFIVILLITGIVLFLNYNNKKNESLSNSAIFLVSCENKEKLYELYLDDNLVKLSYEGNIYLTDIPSNQQEYTCYDPTGIDRLESIGIIYNGDNSGYYSFEKNKILYKDKYKYNNLFENGKYLEGIISDDTNIDTKIEILSTEEEKIIKSIDLTEIEKNSDCRMFGAMSIYSLGDFFILSNSDCKKDELIDSNNVYRVYDSNFNEIANNVEKNINLVDLNDKDLFINQNNVVVKFNNKGEKTKSSNQFDSVKAIIKGYIIAVKDDKLLLTTIDGKEKELANWNENIDKFIIISSDNSKLEFVVEQNVGNSSEKIDEFYNKCNDKVYDIDEDRNFLDFPKEGAKQSMAVIFGYKYNYLINNDKVEKTCIATEEDSLDIFIDYQK